MSQKKKIGAIICFSLLAIFVVAGYLTIIYTRQDYKLEREIKSLTKLDITKDKFDTQCVTTGDYKKVEEAIKSYLQEYATNLQEINKIVNGDEFTKLLTYENLSTDTNFRNSILYINQVSSKLNTYIDKLIIMCNKDNIENNITSYNLDKYYVDTYNELMSDKELLDKFNLSKTYLENYRKNINNKISACNNLFLFLNNNQKNIKFEDGQLKLNSDQLMQQYNQYVNELRA